MNYDEGEVACYPTDSAFDGELVLPCFLDSDLMLMEEGVLPPMEQPTMDTTLRCSEPEPELAQQPLFDVVNVSVDPILISDLTPEIQLQPTIHSRMQSLPLQTRAQAIPQTRIITKPVMNFPQASSPVACYPPAIAFPFVPFWTGCPLPFDPRTYPQPVVPQTPHLSESNNSKEEKISKYRQKRCKRNFNRPVDPQRSSLAEKRPRDEKGKFSEPPSPSMGKRVERSLLAQVEELKERLALSETESRALKEKLSYMEQELRLLKLTTLVVEDGDQDQRPIDRPKMSTSPPTPYGFTSTNTLLQDCYTEKIDFSKIELRKTDSPHLEAERRKTDGKQPLPLLSLPLLSDVTLAL